jgi:hypothetical protein
MSSPPANAVTSRMDHLEESVMRISSLMDNGLGTVGTSFRSLNGVNGTVPAVLVTPPLAGAAMAGQPGQPGVQAGGHATGGGQRGYAEVATRAVRSRSNSQKRKAEEEAEGGDERQGRPRSEVETGQRNRRQERQRGEEEGVDNDGFRRQGRPRVRKTASGSSQVQVEGINDYIAPVEYYIGNTSNRITDEDIKTILIRCAAAVEGGQGLVVDEVKLLTKEEDPRTKCWKVVIPYKFKDIMEKDDVYPRGWRHRKFFGSRNTKEKRTGVDSQDSMEQQVLRERQTELENLVKRQKEERDLLLVMQQAQKEEESRLVHEAERLKLLEDRMKGATASGAQPMGSASD